MKRMTLILSLLFCSRCFALGDIERGVLFVANSYSMGTFIARMEAQMNQIKADYDKKLAESRLSLEQDRQKYLKAYWARALEAATVHREFLLREARTLRERSGQFGLVLELSRSLFRGVLTKESLVVEIKKLSEVSNTIQADWDELLQSVTDQKQIENISSVQAEELFLQAIQLQTHASDLQEQVEEAVSAVDAEIEDLKLKMETIK